MKIAITGGSGFIGTRLAALLEAQGYICVIIDLKHNKPVDILDVPALRVALQGCEAIYNLAAEHRDDVFPRSRYYDVNVTGMKNILNIADEMGIKRIIFTSSFAVYGLDAKTPDEISKPAPFNDYGQSKLEAEEVLRDWSSKNIAVQVTIVRPVVVFGENNRGNVHTLIDQVSRGKFVMVGNGGNKKSIAYVGNVAAFLAHLLPETERLNVYNYADKPDLTVTELMSVVYQKLGKKQPSWHLPYILGLAAGYIFDLAARITGRNFPISAVRVQKFCADTTSDASKAMRNFTPPYSLSEGLERMIDHDFLRKNG